MMWYPIRVKGVFWLVMIYSLSVEMSGGSLSLGKGSVLRVEHTAGKVAGKHVRRPGRAERRGGRAGKKTGLMIDACLGITVCLSIHPLSPLLYLYI